MAREILTSDEVINNLVSDISSLSYEAIEEIFNFAMSYTGNRTLEYIGDSLFAVVNNKEVAHGGKESFKMGWLLF